MLATVWRGTTCASPHSSTSRARATIWRCWRAARSVGVHSCRAHWPLRCRSTHRSWRKVRWGAELILGWVPGA